MSGGHKVTCGLPLQGRSAVLPISLRHLTLRILLFIALAKSAVVRVSLMSGLRLF